MTKNNCEKYIGYIARKLDERTILEQLAEEASEVAQAALKLIRAKELSNNATPKTEHDAMLELLEELMDFRIVQLLLRTRDDKFTMLALSHNLFDVDDLLKSPKWKRWAERLGYKEK